METQSDYVTGVQPHEHGIVANGWYNREYAEARDHFRSVDERWPEATTTAAMDAMIWQAMMLENFDFRFDSQYEVATAQARQDLTAALAKPGFEGWEHFLLAGIIGIESIHMVRKERYVAALPVAFEAMDHAQKSREAAPDFVDLKLADGIYNYWRTVITESPKVLPDFGDHREEGLDQMREVQTYAVFMDSPATLSLSFSWLEEGNFKRAIAETSRNKREYPDSIINLLVHGQIETYMRRYDSALATWDRILEVDPKNNRVHYWKAVTYIRKESPRRPRRACDATWPRTTSRPGSARMHCGVLVSRCFVRSSSGRRATRIKRPFESMGTSAQRPRSNG